MKAFLKENFVLALGVSLPVILIAVFMIAQSMTKLVDPPQYKAVFSLSHHNNNDATYRFEVKDKKLVATYKKPDKNNTYNHNTRLYIFDPVKDDVEEIILEAPDSAKEGKWVNVSLSTFKNIRLNPDKESPDGYIFEQYYRSNGNFFSGFFGYYSSRARYALSKQSRHVPIKGMRNPYGRDTFIGWVIKEEDGQ